MILDIDSVRALLDIKDVQSRRESQDTVSKDTETGTAKTTI